uniref:PB1-like domain-containing protein n=1 Tax=Chenopodium quinoa TaxID=63459 RepID=A0A803L511_CHEQI
MWHGGVFETGNNGQLRYRNGEGRTFSIDPDELCSFYLVELVMKCAKYDGRIKGFLYLVPGLSMVDGLRKVTDDESMRDMIQVAEKYRGVESYEWEDSRPDSPIPINDLIPDYSTESDHEDPPYNPLVDKGKGVSSKPFFGEVYSDHSDEDVESDGEQGADPSIASQAVPSTQASQVVPSAPQGPNTSHYNQTAQPTILGRGGRMINMRRGSRGGRGSGDGAGRGVVTGGRGATAAGRGVDAGSGVAAGRGSAGRGVSSTAGSSSGGA